MGKKKVFTLDELSKMRDKFVREEKSQEPEIPNPPPTSKEVEVQDANTFIATVTTVVESRRKKGHVGYVILKKEGSEETFLANPYEKKLIELMEGTKVECLDKSNEENKKYAKILNIIATNQTAEQVLSFLGSFPESEEYAVFTAEDLIALSVDKSVEDTILDMGYLPLGKSGNLLLVQKA